MAELVDTLIEDERWEGARLGALAQIACAAVLAHAGLPAERFAISLLGCGDDRIARLNAEFRGRATATNVLSWPAADLSPAAPGGAPRPPQPGNAEEPEELGDIAIAYETCAREAAEQGKDFAAHVTHLLVHACLHLLGFDHIEPADAALMEGAEVEILAKLGIADPYE